jgi:superfamily II DNA/RNA helicase
MSMTVAPAPGFAELGVPEPLVASLARTGISTAFPIQAATLPDSLAGRDVLGRGRTGSGKTVAFAIPVVVALTATKGDRKPTRPRGLVLVPTRELAAQVADTLVPLARAAGLRVTTVYGGVSQGPQVKALREGVDIVVACPGRLEDLIGQGHCRLDNVSVAVLDEADHMADLGFLPSVKRLLDATPAGGQRLLFSATLDRGVDTLVRRYLHEPVTHSVDSAASPVPAMTHHVLEVSSGDKSAVVRALASGEGRSLLFTRTKYGAKKLAAQLAKQGIPSVELHGNLSQAARARNLAAYSDGRARVLVATDIAARGIHVDEIGIVVHVDPPAEHKAYLHRSGRTARAGAEGVVVTLMMPNQRRDVQGLMRAAGITAVTTKVTPGDPLLAELVGPAAAKVAYTPLADPAPTRSRPGQSARRNGPGGQRRDGAGRSGPPGRRSGPPRRSSDDASGSSRPSTQRAGSQRGESGRSESGRSESGRSESGRSESGRSESGRSESGRPGGARNGPSSRPGSSAGRPKAGGAKPAGRPKPAGRGKSAGSAKHGGSGKPARPGGRPSGGPSRGAKPARSRHGS